MARRLYSLLLYLLMPLIVARLLWRGLRAPGYRRRIKERFGLFPAPGFEACLWLHAVSVGETIASAPLVHALRARHPELPIVLTTTTPTGSERVRALFGDAVFHVYAPYDLPGAVARFMARVRPRLALIMETELWPNTLHHCRARGIPALLLNARLSARSARGYARLAPLTRDILDALGGVAAQAQADGERFVALGLARERLHITGSIKFDIAIDAEIRQRARALRSSWGSRPVWIAASTHAGEDAAVLAAHRRVLAQHPDALLVLVPRHPERFAGVHRQIGAAGLSAARRSESAPPAGPVQVLLGDSMGELLMLYGASDVAFVGGSLVPRGGHNMLEPAAWGLPILTGPSDFNFTAISQKLRAAGAMQIIEGETGLAGQVAALLADAALREQRGRAGLAVIDANRGALARQLALIDQLLAAQVLKSS